MTSKLNTVRLPAGIIGRADVARTLRELQILDELMAQAALLVDTVPTLPRVSQLTRELADINAFEIALAADRARLIVFLEKIKKSAPVLHMSFASEPSLEATMTIIEWLRLEINSYALLQIGLQPSIVAGCMLRTANKVFDFSMHRRLEDSKSVLRESIGALRTTS